MINAFAVSNYRSLKNIVAPLTGLNVVTGPNGCGKSNLYKSLRLLAETTKGNLISSIAQEGGLDYTFWAGPMVKVRNGRKWEVYNAHLNTYESILNEISDPVAVPEVHAVRQTIRNWRFYDQFRTDPQSIIRTPQIGTRTPVLDHDGHSLVAALRTIHEIGDRAALYDAIEDAFPGATINVEADSGNRFIMQFLQDGLLRPLNQAELSDGTLRYLLLVAVLLTPRPPSLLVLNEPETSLHPDLLPALGRLIIRASHETQVWVVSHAPRLVATLEQDSDCNSIALNKDLGETVILGQGLLDAPPWQWAD